MVYSLYLIFCNCFISTYKYHLQSRFVALLIFNKTETCDFYDFCITSNAFWISLSWYIPFILFFKAIIFGGIEEVGWRYIFQPVLQERRNYILFLFCFLLKRATAITIIIILQTYDTYWLPPVANCEKTNFPFVGENQNRKMM